MTDTNSIYNQLGVSDKVLRFGQEVLAGLSDQFRHIDQVAEFNQAKVIAAMQKNRVNATHFNLSTGYGYDDEGRDNLERVYADCFGTEAALVRPQITCGTHAGYLALYVGVAVGATAVLVPEHPYDFKVQVADNIRHARLNGKTNFMIVVAEGAASAVEVGRQIQEELALDPRVTILGHIQRGGSPTAKDRVMATRMGYEAVRVLAEGKTNRVICAKDDQIIDLDIDEGLAMKKTLNSEEFKVMTVMTGM